MRRHHRLLLRNSAGARLQSGRPRAVGSRLGVVLRAAKLLLELLVAELELLDRAGELAHLRFEPIDPHHELGLGHLRARSERGKRECARERGKSRE